MMPRYILLSYVLQHDTPTYSRTPNLSTEPFQKIKDGHPCNTSLIHIHTHVGTHVDAPFHFSDAGKKITDYSIEELIFSHPLILNLPKNPAELITLEEIKHHQPSLHTCDIVLLQTGFWKYRDEERYRLQNPGIAPEVAEYIRTEFPNIRCVGIDSISVSSYRHRDLGRKTHEIFLKHKEYTSDPVLLVEDMDLSSNHLKRVAKVFVCPLFIKDLDGSPCTVLGALA